MKVTVLLYKLLKSCFDEKFFWRERISRFSALCTLLSVYDEEYFVKSTYAFFKQITSYIHEIFFKHKISIFVLHSTVWSFRNFCITGFLKNFPQNNFFSKEFYCKINLTKYLPSDTKILQTPHSVTCIFITCTEKIPCAKNFYSRLFPPRKILK